MYRKNNDASVESAKRMLSMFDRIPDEEKENAISYIAGIADATARMKQREKNER